MNIFNYSLPMQSSYLTDTPKLILPIEYIFFIALKSLFSNFYNHLKNRH